MKRDRFGKRLSAYKDGELDGELSEQISSHLRQCPACREELAELDRVDSLVKKMTELVPGECFSLRIIAGISLEERARPGFSPFYRRAAQRVLQFALSFHDLLSGEDTRPAALDEFKDFPPLSMSSAYFGAAGLYR